MKAALAGTRQYWHWTLTNVFYAAVKPGACEAENPLGTALRDILGRIGDRMSPSWHDDSYITSSMHFTAKISGKPLIVV